jgi:hypothetical protein
MKTHTEPRGKYKVKPVRRGLSEEQRLEIEIETLMCRVDRLVERLDKITVIR